jgi:hypothetical protein
MPDSFIKNVNLLVDRLPEILRKLHIIDHALHAIRRLKEKLQELVRKAKEYMEKAEEFADKAKEEADRAESEADRAKNEADRAKDEADRAEGIADGIGAGLGDLEDKISANATAIIDVRSALETLDIIGEAPVDNKLYGRKNADWEEILNSGGSGGESGLQTKPFPVGEKEQLGGYGGYNFLSKWWHINEPGIYVYHQEMPEVNILDWFRADDSPFPTESTGGFEPAELTLTVAKYKVEETDDYLSYLLVQTVRCNVVANEGSPAHFFTRHRMLEINIEKITESNPTPGEPTVDDILTGEEGYGWINIGLQPFILNRGDIEKLQPDSYIAGDDFGITDNDNGVAYHFMNAIVFCLSSVDRKVGFIISSYVGMQYIDDTNPGNEDVDISTLPNSRASGIFSFTAIPNGDGTYETEVFHIAPAKNIHIPKEFQSRYHASNVSLTDNTLGLIAPEIEYELPLKSLCRKFWTTVEYGSPFEFSTRGSDLIIELSNKMGDTSYGAIIRIYGKVDSATTLEYSLIDGNLSHTNSSNVEILENQRKWRIKSLGYDTFMISVGPDFTRARIGVTYLGEFVSTGSVEIGQNTWFLTGDGTTTTWVAPNKGARVYSTHYRFTLIGGGAGGNFTAQAALEHNTNGHVTTFQRGMKNSDEVTIYFGAGGMPEEDGEATTVTIPVYGYTYPTTTYTAAGGEYTTDPLTYTPNMLSPRGDGGYNAIVDGENNTVPATQGIGGAVLIEFLYNTYY